MKFIHFFFCFFIFSSILSAQTKFAKIGANPGSINSSAALELESTNKGFLPPRMSQAQRDAIGLPATPAEGLVVYCTDCTPKGLYNYNGTAWENLNSGVSSSLSVVVDCTSASYGFVGTYNSGVALSSASFKVAITNNSLSNVGPLTFAAGDLVLSGVTGLSVSTPSPASATINPGASQIITYTITGTPASSGTLTGTWNKLSLSCSTTKTVSP